VLDKLLISDFELHKRQQLSTYLKSFLSKRLIETCAELTGIDTAKLCSQVTSQQRAKLRMWLKDFRFDISGHRSFNEAIVTAGASIPERLIPNDGVRIVKGLYFAGEVLNIDGDTGGYNCRRHFPPALPQAIVPRENYRCRANFRLPEVPGRCGFRADFCRTTGAFR